MANGRRALALERQTANRVRLRLAIVVTGFLVVTNAVPDDGAEPPPRVSIVVSSIQPINPGSESVAVEFTSGLVRALAEYPDVELLTMLEVVPHADSEDPSGPGSYDVLILIGDVGWVDDRYEAHFELVDPSMSACPLLGHAASNDLGLIIEVVKEPVLSTVTNYQEEGAQDQLRKCRFKRTDKACFVRIW